MANFKSESDLIKVSGSFDAESAIALGKILPESGVSFLDFSDVDSISFAAQRKLLQMARSGKRISIINASDAVCERMEDTGVASIMSVCRKPRPIDMSKYQEFGGGFVAKSYYSDDGDAVLKYFPGSVNPQIVYQEKALAQAALLFGIPTPMVGTIYGDNGNLALDFERIEGKKSLSRIISEDFSRMEEVTVKFARMCKQLHATPCDTAIFSDRREFYRKIVSGSTYLDDDSKSRVMSFIDNIPSVTTCIHGDMQPSNIIETPDGEDLWIDLGDFGYGYPMLDMGMWYVLAKQNKEEVNQHVFHMSNAQMAQIWDIFFKEYFNPETPEQAASILEEVDKYAALHMIYLGTAYGFGPHFVNFIKDKLGADITLDRQ